MKISKRRYLSIVLVFNCFIFISCQTSENISTERKNPSSEKVMVWQNREISSLESSKKENKESVEKSLNYIKEKSEKHSMNYEYDEAAPYLWQLVESNSQDVESKLLLIDNLLKRSLYRDALSLLNQTNIKDANPIHLQKKELYYALILKGLREFELAEKRLIGLIDRFPKFEQPYHQLFDFLMERIDYEAAFKLINRTIERCGRNEANLKRLAHYYLKIGDSENSKKIIDEILNIDLSAPEGLLLLAELQLNSDLVDAANMNIEIVLKKHPMIFDALLIKAKILEKQGKSEQAEAAILKALKQRPLDGNVRLVLAEFYSKNKQKQLDARRLFYEAKVLSHPYSGTFQRAESWIEKINSEYL